MSTDGSPRSTSIFFGHHKAATSWIIKVLSDLAYLNHFRFKVINTAAELDPSLIARLLSGRTPFLVFRNSDRAYLDKLGPFRGFHIIRDPRDIIVSSYFSHLKTHPTTNWPELAEHQASLKALPFDEGLIADMKFCAKLPTAGFAVRPFQCLRDWDYDNPSILELRYEEIFQCPYETFLEVFRFLEVLDPAELGFKSLVNHITRIVRSRLPLVGQRTAPSIPTWNLLTALYENRFTKMAGGRSRGDENKDSHYRKGVAGDWKNYFNEAHKDFFKRQFGDLVVQLGYATDNQW